MLGPNRTVPVLESQTMCLSCGPEPEKSSTSVQASTRSPCTTSTVSSDARGSTGRWVTSKACAGEPSLRPICSPGTVSACSASTVPPRATALTSRTFGEAL